MLKLSEETSKLAERLALIEGIHPDLLVRNALLEKSSLANDRRSIQDSAATRAKSSAIMLKFGADMALLPVIDDRPVDLIVDDVNSL